VSVLLARRYRVDATTDLTLAAGWLEVKRITDFDPNVNPNVEDATAYDTNGVSAGEVTMMDAGPTLTFLSAIVTAVRDPGQTIILNTTGQFDVAARCGLRWYDRNGLAGRDNGSAVVIPTLKRAQTGVKNLESVTATCPVTDGVLNLGITNPGTAATVPIILTATPSGLGAGGLLTITGSAFTGTTALTIGGVATPSRVIESDNLIVCALPAGSAGSAPIIVTNAVGASASFPYTRVT
jgi:hypothetical protein